MTVSRGGMAALPFQNWRAMLSSVLWSGLTVIGLVLTSRKLSGAFVRELSATAACFSATLAVLVSFTAAALHRADHRSDSPANTNADCSAGPVLVAIVALTAPLLIGLAIVPGDSPAALFYAGGLLLFLSIGIVLLMTDSLLFHSLLFHRKPTMILSARFPSPATTEIAWLSTKSPAATSDLLVTAPQDNTSLPQDDESVSQQFTRTRTAAGTERISGSMTVCFAAGQRQATIHLPFVPPLDGSPTVVCEVADGHAVRLKVAAVHPYGVRIELKRSADSEMTETIEIGFTVTTKEVRSTAA